MLGSIVFSLNLIYPITSISIDASARLLHVELSEDHICGLGDLLWLCGEANLIGVLSLQRHAILLKLLVGL